MLMWKYGEHKAGLIIPCVISAVKSTPPMRAGTTTQLCLPFLLTHLSRGVTGIYHSNADESEFLLTRPSRGATSLNTAFSEIVTFLLTRPSRGATVR